MEIILNQEYKYSVITPFKNYSTFPRVDRPKTGKLRYDTDNLELNSTISDIFGNDNYIIPRPENQDLKRFKRTHFFYIDDDIEGMARIDYGVKNDKFGLNVSHKIYTTKDKHIINHYGNPFSEIEIHILRRTITRNGDKITIKAYRHYKRREFNQKYFRKVTYVDSLTLNTKTGNFTTLNYSVGKKGTKTTLFRTNSFSNLYYGFIKGIDGPFKFLKNHMDNKSPLIDELKEVMNNKEFQFKIKETLQLDSIYFDQGNAFPEFFFKQIIDWFIKNKKIKTPNEYHELITKNYPTEKFLKKNDRKLIASILDMYQIKSKITIKILHDNPQMDIELFARLCYLFGGDFPKYIGTIKKEVFSNIKRRNDNTISHRSSLLTSKYVINQHKEFGFLIKDAEKENIVKLYNSFDDREYRTYEFFSEPFFNLLIDHFRMIKRVREFNPDLIMTATTSRKFDEEHGELTKIIRAIKKGYVIQYVYPEKTLEEIQQPYKVFKSIKIGPTLMGTDMDDYQLIIPHVLTREEEYIEEGNYMHHCVATYAETDTSMIVSLRVENGKDRVTCEFKLSDGRLVQARHFSNKVPPEYFNGAIEHVSDIIRLNARFGTLGWIKKDKVPIKINGVEIKKEDREPRRLGDILDLGDALPLPF